MPLAKRDLMTFLERLTDRDFPKDELAGHRAMEYMIYMIPETYRQDSPGQFVGVKKIHILATFRHPMYVTKPECWAAHRIVLEYDNGTMKAFMYPVARLDSGHEEQQFLGNTIIRGMEVDGWEWHEDGLLSAEEYVSPRSKAKESGILDKLWEARIITSKDEFAARAFKLTRDRWQSEPLNYTELTPEVFGVLRPLFFEEYVKFVKSRGGDPKKFNTLVSVGAGEGDCMSQAVTYFPEAGRVVLLDLNRGNVEKAAARLSKETQAKKRVIGLVNEHTDLLKACKKYGVGKMLGFAMGCLTVGVTSGSRSAMLCIQQAFRTCDFFGVAGATSPLISYEMLRRSGWMPHYNRCSEELFPDKRSRPLYFMSKPTTRKECQEYIQQATNGKLLDFYLCANPLLFLSEIGKPMEAITTLDLRFAYFECKEEWMVAITILAEKLPKLKYIRVEFDDPWKAWLHELPAKIGTRQVVVKEMERKGPIQEVHIRKCSVSTRVLQAICDAENATAQPRVAETAGQRLMVPQAGEAALADEVGGAAAAATSSLGGAKDLSP